MIERDKNSEDQMKSNSGLSQYSRHFAAADDQYAASASEQVSRPFELYRTRHDVALLRSHLRQGDVLDFPIGTARVFPHLLENFIIWGKDIAPAYIELAKKAYPAIADRFSVGSFEEPNEARQFDGIYSLRSVNNVNDLELAIANVARLLKPGGVWMFNLPPKRTQGLSASLTRSGLDLTRRIDYDWISSVAEMTAAERIVRRLLIAGIARKLVSYPAYRLVDRLMPRKGLAMIVASKPR